MKLHGWKRVRAWLSATKAQIKGQHKLIRIFYMKYDIGEDPSNKPTGAQKATVIFAIVLMRMTVAAMYCDPSALEHYEEKGGSSLILSKVVNGMIAAALTIPATVLLDRMFMKAQRVTNRRVKGEGTESEVAKLAITGMSMVLSSVDTRAALTLWSLTVEQIKVDAVRQELDVRHLRRVNSRMEEGDARRRQIATKKLGQKNDVGTLPDHPPPPRPRALASWCCRPLQQLSPPNSRPE